MNKQIEALNDDDAHLAKHANEYHGLTLKQFVLMCEEADKRYEGQFSSAVDKALAVECFYEGFKIACKEALAEAENQEIGDYEIKAMLDDIEWYQQEQRKLIDRIKELEKKEWQSLSDDEIRACLYDFGHKDFLSFARAIEQALKEKNHG